MEKIIQANTYEERNGITEEQAKEYATERVDFVGGKFVGYYVVVLGWGESLLVFDAETHYKVFEDLGIYYHTKDENELKAKQREKAERALFDPDIIATTVPKDYDEQIRRIDFAINIYPKRYDYISAVFIGKASKEQEEAASNRFLSYVNYGYYRTKEQADDVARLYRAARSKGSEALADLGFLENAFLYEMFNHEYAYSEEERDVIRAVGLDENELTAEQWKAFHEAERRYNKEMSKYGF